MINKSLYSLANELMVKHEKELAKELWGLSASYLHGELLADISLDEKANELMLKHEESLEKELKELLQSYTKGSDGVEG